MKIKLICILIFAISFTEIHADKIKIGLEVYEPHYISGKELGVIPKLITAVFSYIPEHQPIFIQGFPNKRLLASFQKNQLDAAPNLTSKTKFDGCLSDPIFKYQNVAISKRSSNIKISKISDLTNKKMVSFQGATRVLGEKFRSTISDKKYVEVTNLELQAKMLIRGRVEISIVDKLIFLQTLKDLNLVGVSTDDFIYHDIFKPYLTHVGFHDKGLCKPFNAALKKVFKSGEYDRIYNSYYEKLLD